MDTFNPNQMPPMPTQVVEEKKSIGPLIAVIIILALIVVGGLYFLKQRSAVVPYTPPTEVVTEEDNVTASLNTQSNSDDLNSIEADLNATNINDLDQGAAALEAQMQ